MIVDTCLVSLPEILHTIYHETTFEMSPLIFTFRWFSATTMYTLYVAVGIYIWEKDLLHVGNECIQKFHYDWRWKGGSISPIDILLLTFPHNKNATWKKKFFFVFLMRWNNKDNKWFVM